MDGGSSSMTTPSTTIIVGAGLAGTSAAQTLRSEGFDGRLLLVGDDPQLPYDRPPLSKSYLSGDTSRAQVTLHEEASHEAGATYLPLTVHSVLIGHDSPADFVTSQRAAAAHRR